MKDRIKKLRKSLDLTQQEFANKIGMKQNTIAQYEMGRTKPSDAIIFSICREFNVNEEWLRNGEGEIFKRLLPGDEYGAYAAELLSSDPEDPFYGYIIEMMRTYGSMDEISKATIREYFRKLRENLENKKEG